MVERSRESVLVEEKAGRQHADSKCRKGAVESCRMGSSVQNGW